MKATAPFTMYRPTQSFMVPAAVVNCEFDRVFETTISQSWLTHDEVEPYGDDGYADMFMSSTSVSNIFSDADGKFCIVLPAGIAELSKDVNGKLMWA